MRGAGTFTWGALPLLVCCWCAPAPAAAERPFIRVEGTRFWEGSRPFYFVGANLNLMHGERARQQASRTLAAAAADGLRVGRIWALGEGPGGSPAWRRQHYLFRDGPQGWQEHAFRHLDRVLAEAGRRGLRLIITLSNRWSDYGGLPMYLRWAGQPDVASYGHSDRFFADPRCRFWFWEHVRRVVGRTNSVTGVRYSEDPTILSWELQNELHGTPEAAPLRRRWTADLARQIRGLDRRHLIVPGHVGYSLVHERQDWIDICALPEVAYCDQHLYPREHLRSRTHALMQRQIDERVQLAHHVVGKPIVFGEFGFADRGSAARRATWHRRFLQRLFFDGGNGALVWIYQPSLSWRRRFGVLVDRRRYRGLRRTLGAVARRVARRAPRNGNPALGPQRGDTPIAPTHALLAGWRRPHRRWARRPGQATLELPVDRFHSAWFEDGGSWDGGDLVHAYGRRSGWLEYRFRGPGFSPARLEIHARLSSEFPGRSAPPGGTSAVRVLLDGRQVALLRVRPDDGLGAWHEVHVPGAALPRGLGRGVHRLRFQVTPGPGANGVAIYGRPGRRPAKSKRPLVGAAGPLRLVAIRGGRGSR